MVLWSNLFVNLTIWFLLLGLNLMPIILVLTCHQIVIWWLEEVHEHLAISVKGLSYIMFLIMELIVFLKEKFCTCCSIKTKNLHYWGNIDTIIMSDFRDNQLKKITILDAFLISLFYKHPNRLKIDKTSKLVTLDQNLHVFF